MNGHTSIFQRGNTVEAPCRRAVTGRVARLATAVLLFATTSVASAQMFFPDHDESFLPSPVRKISTVPGNGDVNPYGVAFVGDTFQAGSGPLKTGDILISNFNNSANLQGTGTTIVRVPANGSKLTTFFQGQAGLGLTTALGTLHEGLILVGNGPTVDGTAATAQPGSLLVIDNRGQLLQTITGPDIQYPWDMTVVDQTRVSGAVVFLTNALTGTVSRITFRVGANGLTRVNSATVASGYVHRADPAALFVAPTGLVYDSMHDVLYVASSGDNAVYAISQAVERTGSAGTGSVVYMDNAHLHGALAMAMAPNGDLLVSNNDAVNVDAKQPSEIVEFTTAGRFVKEISMDRGEGGSFGMAVRTVQDQATFAAVDDVDSTIVIWQLNL